MPITPRLNPDQEFEVLAAIIGLKPLGSAKYRNLAAISERLRRHPDPALHLSPDAIWSYLDTIMDMAKLDAMYLRAEAAESMSGGLVGREEDEVDAVESGQEDVSNTRGGSRRNTVPNDRQQPPSRPTTPRLRSVSRAAK